jgi:NAD(P)-dependent dehydrogenase (short-subunit alcohol dehydrogenase family)
VTHLTGRHALVTGASRGIGAAIVRSLSSAGASVSLMVRDRHAAAPFAAALAGPRCVVTADVTDASAVRSACAEAADQLGPVDLLVNNAGFVESAPFLKSPPELFRRTMEVHLLGAVHTVQAVLPGMIERGRGHVVNMASIAGLRGESYVSAYVAAKHALVGLTRALAVEFGRRGVAVDAVCPGYTETELVRSAVARVVARTGRSEHDALEAILAGAGQTRLIDVEEVATAVLELVTTPSPGAARIVVLDGSTAS